ncbi:MAG: zinc ribbon domain-containing protein [Clostridia bacterium]|nr:zinc ribbon domain-containing protein [Clostridia bacterium]
MEILIIFIVVISIIRLLGASAAKKARQSAAAADKEAPMRGGAPAGAPPRVATPRADAIQPRVSARVAAAARTCRHCGRAVAGDRAQFCPHCGRPLAEAGASRVTAHVVRPAVGGAAHAHTESSMTGIVDCPPALDLDAVRVEVEEPAAQAFSLSKDELVRGIVLSEILGKPKALRGRGGY